MDLNDLRLGALLARLRAETSQAADDIGTAEHRSDFEHGWARGYAKGLARAVALVRDFLG
jgi:hypothetical protein